MEDREKENGLTLAAFVPCPVYGTSRRMNLHHPSPPLTNPNALAQMLDL